MVQTKLVRVLLLEMLECSIWPCPCLELRDFKAINKNFNVGDFLEGKLADLRDATGRDFLSLPPAYPYLN